MNRFPRVTLLILLTQPPHLSDQDSVVPTTRLQQRMTKGIPGQAASARLRSALSIAVMCCASAAAVAETAVVVDAVGVGQSRPHRAAQRCDVEHGAAHEGGGPR